MKVISGKYKGRIIKGFNIDGTRPTMDRVKESVFGMIQNYVEGSVVLDLFAGTGNYGIEALSNGAQFAYFNDHNKKCFKVINDNLKEFHLEAKSIVLSVDYLEALRFLEKKEECNTDHTDRDAQNLFEADLLLVKDGGGKEYQDRSECHQR